MDELQYVRDLAKRVSEFAHSAEMTRRRELWTDHNSFIFTRPPIYLRAVPIHEYPQWKNVCESPLLRDIEGRLKRFLFLEGLEDDTITEPFITIDASVDCPENGAYGMRAGISRPGNARCGRFDPSIVEESDADGIHSVPYRVRKEETQRNADRFREVLDGILDVAVDTQGHLCRMWSKDISTNLTQMRGMDNLLYDFYDRPEWLHSVIERMQQCVIRNLDETEQAGGLRSVSNQNQAMCYCRELDPPTADDRPVKASDIWGYMAAQEFDPVGPELFDEFMFSYQQPILERYGLAAYGCCEDLTRKIPVIRRLKNLRRIAVSPFANVEECAKQIGQDYIISYRPNPATACSDGIDEEYVRKEINGAADIFDRYGCKWDVTLKDLETTSGDQDAIGKWTHIIRTELDRRYCR